ncbi:hypothetical protein [Microcoleus sp. OTE_8_concoct_300]|uniref:hypothetical protein n=1 Tax=Microcoleus sp. OTE_8_concoct_300 TaxID=2964710 RepID=UPI00403F6A06
MAPVQSVVDRPGSNSSKSGDREMKLAGDGTVNRKVLNPGQQQTQPNRLPKYQTRQCKAARQKLLGKLKCQQSPAPQLLSIAN